MLGVSYDGRRRPIALDLEAIVPPDHLLRRVDRVLDLSFLPDLVAPLFQRGKGRPSIPVETFFRMQILAYLDRIPSDRQLIEAVRVNAAYRWFLRLAFTDPVPDHSSLTRMRDRLGEKTFALVFDQIVEQCQGRGLLKGKRLAVDATLVKANASIDSMTSRDQAGASEKAQPSATASEQAPNKSRHRQARLTNQTHVSRTDPEATLAKQGNGKSLLSYKLHLSADVPSRVITDCHVTTGAVGDGSPFLERLARQVSRFHLAPNEVLADKRFASGETYHILKTAGVTSYIPIAHECTGAKRLPRSAFRYDEDDDLYVCPAGAEMEYVGRARQTVDIYKAEKEDCDTCPLRPCCLSARSRVRTVSRSLYQNEIDRVRKRMTTPHFKAKMTERFWSIEGVIAETKLRRGLSRVRYRGRAKVQIEAYLAATAHNLRRLRPRFN